MQNTAIRLELLDEAATRELAARLAPLARAGDVLALDGDLGSGKSVFARAFIRAVEALAEEEVPSPTFTLVQVYDAGPLPVYHFDLYRLEDPEEAFELDIEEAFAEAVSLIEWPDRLGRLLPPRALRVGLAQGAAEEQRIATLSAAEGDWPARLREAGLG